MDSPNRWEVRSAATALVGARAEPLDQVGEHRAGLDGGELVGVADQHQPGLRAHRLEQPGHHRQRHHRGLVDDDHVVRQPVVAVVAEPGRRVRAPAEQPVQGHRLQPGEPGLVVGARSLPTSSLDRLLQPGGGLAGRRGEGDPQRRLAGVLACSASSASSAATVVVLPVPGPPVSTVVPAASAIRAAARCSSYPCAGKTRPRPPRGERGLVGVERRHGAGRASRSAQTCSSSRQ